MKGAIFIFALVSVLALARGHDNPVATPNIPVSRAQATAGGLLEADSDAELKASVRRRLQTRNLLQARESKQLGSTRWAWKSDKCSKPTDGSDSPGCDGSFWSSDFPNTCGCGGAGACYCCKGSHNARKPGSGYQKGCSGR